MNLRLPSTVGAGGDGSKICAMVGKLIDSVKIRIKHDDTFMSFFKRSINIKRYSVSFKSNETQQHVPPQSTTFMLM